MTIKNTNGFCQLKSFVFLYKLILLFNCWEPLWFSCWIMTWRHCAIALQGLMAAQNSFARAAEQCETGSLASAHNLQYPRADLQQLLARVEPRQSALQFQLPGRANSLQFQLHSVKQSLNFATWQGEALEPHLNLWEKARKVRGCKKPRLVARGEG